MKPDNYLAKVIQLQFRNLQTSSKISKRTQFIVAPIYFFLPSEFW